MRKNLSQSKAFSPQKCGLGIFWEASFLKERLNPTPYLVGRRQGPLEDLQVFEPSVSQFIKFMERALKTCNPSVLPDMLNFILRGSQVTRELAM